MEKYCCRLCISESSSFLKVSGEIGNELHIKELIKQHLNLEIKEQDNISNKVCTNCWQILSSFHEFYNEVHAAQGRILEKFAIINEDGTEMKAFVVMEKEATETDDGYTPENQNSSQPQLIEVHMIEDSYGCSTVSNVDDEETRLQTDFSQEDKSISDGEGNHENEINEQTFFVEIRTIAGTSVETNDHLELPQIDTEQRLIATKNRIKVATNPDEDVSIGKFRRRNCRKASEVKNNKISLDEKRKTSLKKHGLLLKKEEMQEESLRQISLIESYYKMQCEICTEIFDSFESLYSHYVAVHEIRGFIMCCGRKFLKRAAIAEHITWHQNPDEFKCSTCDQMFETKKHLTNHTLEHAPDDVELFKCCYCTKTFTLQKKCTLHMLSHLSAEEKQFICEKCQNRYATEALLRAHNRVVHEKTYSHMCEICARVFKSRIFFEKHKLEHLGQNLPRIKCNLCNAWMKNEHTMRAHMRMHQDQGLQHTCDICGKEGPSRNAILKHKRFVHLSERKFKCTFCTKAFKRAITLKEHMTTHTGGILYSCSFCSKTFNSGANMHSHRKKAHPAEWELEKQQKILIISNGGSYDS